MSVTVENKPILAIDFDGVLHLYSRGWINDDIYDPPVNGAVEFIKEAKKYFRIIIHSSRAQTLEDRNKIINWLQKNGFPEVDGVTSIKPPAFVSLDDRAITFTGTFPKPEDLLAFRSWVNYECGGTDTTNKFNDFHIEIDNLTKEGYLTPHDIMYHGVEEAVKIAKERKNECLKRDGELNE